MYNDKRNSQADQRLTVKFIQSLPEGEKEFFYLYRSVDTARRVAATIDHHLGVKVERRGSVLRMAQVVQKEISLKTYAPVLAIGERFNLEVVEGRESPLPSLCFL